MAAATRDVRAMMSGSLRPQAMIAESDLGDVSVGNGDAPSEFAALLVVTRTFFQLMVFASEKHCC